MLPRTCRSLLLCLGVALPVFAAGRAGAEDLAAARACPAISNATARLACFDAAFAVAPPPPAAQFGENDHVQRKLKPVVDVPKSLQLVVVTAAPLGQGLYRLTLDNKQVWETRETNWALTFQSSDVITISRLPFGSYRISKPGVGATVGAKRIE